MTSHTHNYLPSAYQTRTAFFRNRNVSLSVLFTCSILVSAALLFWVQPLIAKMILPLLGGTPAVWNACMLFFQGVLLAGYAYVHGVSRWLTHRQQAIVHVGLLILAGYFMPIAISEDASRNPSLIQNPISWLLTSLVSSVGLPFFILSTTAPLLQKWFSKTGHPASNDPYFLYAASNFGSIFALLSFPVLLEPFLTISQQSQSWAGGYVLLVVLVLICALKVWRAVPQSDRVSYEQGQETLPIRRRLLWVALSFVPSSLMMGVTEYISTDIASVPLLWIIPLTIYLFTFVLVFSKRQILTLSTASRLMPWITLLLLFVFVFSKDLMVSPWMLIVLHLAFFFVATMVCHGRLAKDRPSVEHLTEFYLWVAVGGVLGGIFNVLIAPNVFTMIAEYPLAIMMACALSPRRSLALIAVVAALCGAIYLSVRAETLHTERNFFGVLRVATTEDKSINFLVYGNTIHGRQFTDHARECEPLAYYHRSGPLGSVFESIPNASRVAVIGLGIGTMGSYARSGQQWAFYEINPAVVDIARDTRYFTYLQSCTAAPIEIILGDARLRLHEAQNGYYDMIVLDAFSSDSIPIHLMTKQALELYLSKLSSRGVLVFHVSNRTLDLHPALSGLANSANLAILSFDDSQVDAASGKERSRWVVMARNSADLGGLTRNPQWRPLESAGKDVLWTDDFSNIVSAIRWRRQLH